MNFRMKIVVSICGAILLAGAATCQESPARVKAPLKIRGVEQAVPATDIISVGGFAGDRIKKNKENYLKTFAIGDYIGLVESRHFTAWDWRKGEQPGKWLESSIITAARTHDRMLEREAKGMYERMLKSQSSDGYLGITSDSVRTPEKPLRGMDAYELYFTQHALLTAYEVWKDPKGLAAARRLGDYFLKYIGPGKAEFWPSATHYPENKGKILKGTMHSDIAGHSIHYSWEGTLLIDPMMRLYELTGDPRYYDWCKWVVSNIDKWSGWDAYSNLDKVATGEMTVDKIQPYVHTHTFQLNFIGLLRMYQVSGDITYLNKVAGVWKDIAARQLYITGGVSVGEHYERDYIKPLTGEMMETCATMSWMQLSQYLLDLTGDPRYADAMEKIGWNQVFAEQTIDGDANHYFTPPNGYTPKGYYREPDCCMGSGHRLLSLLPGFIYATGGGAVMGGSHATGTEGAPAIYINQFIESATTIALPGAGKIKIAQQTDYPQDGKIDISIDPVASVPFTVNIRIPSWCKQPSLTVNGKAVSINGSFPLVLQPGAYAKITRVWHPGDHISLELPMELKWVVHDHYRKTSDRKPYKTAPDADPPYALVRGPVVYALDDIWYQGDTSDFGKGWMDTVKYVLEDAALLRPLPAPEKDILGPGYEVPIRLANGKRTLLPVYPFANIGKWYKDPAHKPDSNVAAWTYAVWLKGAEGSVAAAPGTAVEAGEIAGKPAAPVELSLPKILGNNMVLQRDKQVPVWGSAGPGEEVTVSFSGQVKKAVTDVSGHWKLLLDPMAASAQPVEMVITASKPSSGTGNLSGGAEGGTTIRLENILVGEVWLCSGQSNMEYSMRKNSKFEKAAHGAGPEDELNKANNPNIRIFLVRNNYSKPDVHIRRTWDTAGGAPLKDFSAAGYFFAKELYRRLGVPVGVIGAAVSGSAIEPWLPGSGSDGETDDGVLAANDHGFIAGDSAGKGNGGRGKFYETMIRPLAPFALKGFCWYQGETNCFLNDTIRYTDKMKELMGSWRRLWGADLSFYFVQIAPFYYSHSTGGDQAHSPESEPAFWEAQERALSLPHAGMVVTTDLVDSATDLHPAYKWEVGRRLALWALAKDYGKKEIIYSGPVYKSMVIKGRTIVLSFSNVGSGLVSKDGKPLDWFFIAGADGQFVPATAQIKGDNVIVSAAGLASPVAVRFGWNEAAQPTFYNKDGLPAMPFRTDHPIERAEDARTSRETGPAQETQTLYLSGTGNDHTVSWQFYCTEGRQSGKWTTIPVPSNWELQGFGKYNYGLDKDSVRGHEKGLYKYTFTVPDNWKDRVVDIVFDGSMTDTEVKINGKAAGAVHQGSFYRFRYDISRLLHYGKKNLLEVTVAKESANRSVNMAERHCDFWVFGGIFRPVFLEASPRRHISGLAIDAKADGHLVAKVRLEGLGGGKDARAATSNEAHAATGDQLTAQLYTLKGDAVGDALHTVVHAGDTAAILEGTLAGALTWTPESPNLYKIAVTLSGNDGTGHIVWQRLGFRTVALRERDGIYVNGTKIKFKGVCRHSFWPSSGRALNKELSILDVQMMKDMNMNAVRMSHYPPDDHFLDVCDSLGLFVLDELTGWHHAYDTEVGSKLVKEMIVKDVNHPSIVLWDNGNEGGFNFDLDTLFDQLDIQQRPLIHPWAVFRHMDTQHYINYDYGNGTHLHGHEITCPTEFLHGLYDGGHGAGLRDYWEQMWHDPLSAGGFLWDFSDEGVVRTDRNGELDTDGDHGPDGILGPYREKEASYYTIKEVWSPIAIAHREITPAFDGKFSIENRFFYTNINQCRWAWRLEKLAGPGATMELSGEPNSPDILPGQQGILSLALPAGWQQYDVLYLSAKDSYGREIYTWSWPISRPDAVALRIVDTVASAAAVFAENDSSYMLSAGGTRAMFGKKSGLLLQVRNGEVELPFSNGPVLSAGAAEPLQTNWRQEGKNIVLESIFSKASLCQGLKWTMYPSGWLKMEIRYFPPEYEYSLLGINFSYPAEGQVKGISWMGDGPYRVWKNRMEGTTLGVWNKAYNNTITGQGACIYPEFKGYYSNFYWMKLETAGPPITVVCASEDVFLRLFTPANPAHVYNIAPPFPSGELSFMQGIPPIGTKSQKPEKMGPSGQKNMYYDYGKSAAYAKEIILYFNFSGK